MHHPPDVKHLMRKSVQPSGVWSFKQCEPQFLKRVNVKSHISQVGAKQGGGGVSTKCEVMGFCLKLATSKKGGGGLPLLCAAKIYQNAPLGVTVDVHKCVFVHFLGMQKEIWGCLASKVTHLCMLT